MKWQSDKVDTTIIPRTSKDAFSSYGAGEVHRTAGDLEWRDEAKFQFGATAIYIVVTVILFIGVAGFLNS